MSVRATSDRTEIRITGFGGQGVVLAGYIIGRAAAIHGGKNATMIQSFGPEARGSACSATLAVSARPILYPYIGRPDIFVVMSGEGYDKHIGELADNGLVVYEQDLVHPGPEIAPRAVGVPSTRIAETLGRAIVQNIVMVGFFAGVTDVVAPEALREAVRLSVPAGTEELNLAAFDRGLEYAERRVTQPVLELRRPPLEEVRT